MHGCVGKNNYRYFLRFLICVWVGTLYTTAMSRVSVKFVGLSQVQYSKNDSGVHLACFVLSGSILLGITILLSFHVILSLSGQSTIDFMERACDCDNFRDVLRMTALTWRSCRWRNLVAAIQGRERRRQGHHLDAVL